MSLSTFGAVMGFAGELIEHSLHDFKKAAQQIKDRTLKEGIEILIRDEEKYVALMEKTRRENVTEMILEPISGIQGADYKAETALPDSASDADLVRLLLTILQKEQRFFHDASARVSLPEVSRIFRKIAQKKEKDQEMLKSLGLIQVSHRVS